MRIPQDRTIKTFSIHPIGYCFNHTQHLSAASLTKSMHCKAVCIVPCTFHGKDCTAIIRWPMDARYPFVAYDSSDNPVIRGGFCLAKGRPDVMESITVWNDEIRDSISLRTNLLPDGEWVSTDVLTGLDVHWDAFCEVE